MPPPEQQQSTEKPEDPRAKKALPPPEKNLPPAVKDVKGTAQEQVVRNWNAQAKKGIIYQCKQDGCYYPVNQKRDKSNQLMTKKSNDGIKLVMECSWDPRHAGGEQLHAPFKRDDDIDS